MACHSQVCTAVAQGMVAIVDIHFGNSREADLLADVVAGYKATMRHYFPPQPGQQLFVPRQHQLFVRLR